MAKLTAFKAYDVRGIYGRDMDGDTAYAIGRAFARVLADLRGKAPADLRVGDAEDLDLPDASVDSVVCTFALCGIPDHRRALAEMVRVLRPGGRAYIYDMRYAPFDTLVSVARERSLFTGRSPHRATVRLGWLPWPRMTRLVLSTQDSHASVR